MKAIVVDEHKKMLWEEVNSLSPAADEVLIKVHATAINRADLLQRQGLYPPPPGASDVIGLECAGEIEALGAGVSNWKKGERVCALLAGGGYAEYALAPVGSVVRIPEGLSFVEGASLPEVFATAWLNLFIEAGLREGEKVVLHAGASGVGTAAIQLCSAFGNPTFVTAGTDQKISACMELGAQGGSNRHKESFFDGASQFAQEGGVDVILDPVGGAYLDENLRLLGMNGRLVLIGLMSGAQSEINLALLMMKRLRVIGSTLRTRPDAEKTRVMSQLQDKVWPLIESGKINPVIDKVFPVTEVEAAYELVASDKTFGKVVLTVG